MKCRIALIFWISAIAALSANTVAANPFRVEIDIDGGVVEAYALVSVSVGRDGNAVLVVEPSGSVEPPPPPVYSLSYIAGAGGAIRGEIHQSVPEGRDGSEVLAQPLHGYIFSQWSDGVLAASRVDSDVRSPLSVIAQFVREPQVVSGCPDAGGNVKVITTAAQSIPFPSTAFMNASPDDIYAFKFTTKSGVAPSVGVVKNSRIAPAPSAKLIVISDCPGDIQVANKQRYCRHYGYDASMVQYATNSNSPGYCLLTPGKTYYANMAAKTVSTVGLQSYTCATSGSCAFSAEIK
jgi:hypothetical protein